MKTYIGIDVGTGSARAGLFDLHGKLLANHSAPIKTWRPQADFVEQSTADIWSGIVRCVKQVVTKSGVSKSEVKGIGFDATCSLVLVDAQGQPITVSPSKDDNQNVIVWMDHRALEETKFINGLGEFPVHDFVGGKISPEMQIPKLLWVKRNLPESWRRCAHFFDLPDYLTYRATGALSRSLCSTTCKWTYLSHEADSKGHGWHESFFKAAGLEDLVDDHFERIGVEVLPMGKPVGNGLTEKVANDLGLQPGTPVGTSIIDAHAGGIGMIGMNLTDEYDSVPDFDKRLALIGGTSSCHMAVSPEKRFIPGVWGPYYSAMLPDYWLNEGGQSATGALVDHIIFGHQSSDEAQQAAKSENITVYEWLNKQLSMMAENDPVYLLSRDLHVCPYFHGNRSPRADPELRGMISGLRLSAGIHDLALLYLATIQAIAYGTKHIIETMDESGYDIDTLIVCGGGSKNPLFLQQHADICECNLVIPKEPEAVLLGSAMLGAVASEVYPNLTDAMKAMSEAGQIIKADSSSYDFHRAKYTVFRSLYDDQINYQAIMRSGLNELGG